MEFTLHYRGPLKAASHKNKRKDHKHTASANTSTSNSRSCGSFLRFLSFKMPSLFPSPMRWRVVPCCAVSASITSHP
jgi:hypothetical protein